MRDSNPRMSESKSDALTSLANPQLNHIETYCQLDHSSQVCAYLKRPGARLPGSVCFYMVGAVRLELTTYRLKADYSSQLSYAPIGLPLLSLSIRTLL